MYLQIPFKKVAFVLVSLALTCATAGINTAGPGLAATKAATAGSSSGNAAGSAVEDKWAVVIGLSDFADPSVPKLKYSAKDAKDFYDYLTDPNGGKFKKDHVRLLLNSEATKVNIMDALGDSFLPHAANPRDLVVIYMSTHGSPAGADIRGVNYVVAYDTQVRKLFATGIDMKPLLRTIKERVHTNRILLVMDTCYSGAGAEMGHKGIVRTNIDSSAAAQGVGSLVISSSSPEQRSWESDDLKNSYFTRYFIDALKEGGGATNIEQVYKNMSSKVQASVLKDKGEMQTPVMAGIFSGPSLILSSAPTVTREAPITMPDVPGAPAGQARGKGTGLGYDLSSYVEHMNRGAKLIEQNKNWEAIHEVEAATKTNPGTIEGYIVLAQLYDDQSRYPEMLAMAQKAVKNDADSSEGREVLALANLRSGDAAEALRQVQMAVSLDPLNSKAHNLMGYINEHKFNKVDEAEQEYRKALDLNPINTRALVNLGLLLEKKSPDKKEQDEAEALFKKAIESDADDWEAHLSLGRLFYYQHNKPQEAEKEIRKAIELAPANARLHSELGNVLALDKSRLEESENELKKGIELSGQQGVPHYLMANFLLEHRNRIDEAEKEYRKAIQMDPELSDAMVALADLLVEYRHIYDESDALYKRALKINPKDAVAHLGLAQVQEKLFKNGKAAEDEIKSALAINPRYSLAYDRLGDVYTNQGKFGDAQKAYEAAIQSNPSNADANYHLGVLLWTQFHKPSEARKLLEKSMSLDTAKSNYVTALGHLIATEGKDYKESEQLLRKACDINFADSEAHYYLGMLLIEKLNQRKSGEAEIKIAYEQKPDDKLIKAAYERFVH